MNFSSRELQSAISGAYIVMLLDNSSEQDKHKGSVIRLRDKIMGKISNGRYNVVASLANKAYELTKQRYSNEKVEMDIGVLVETIAFNKEKYMKDFYGNDFLSLVSRASVKLQSDGLTIKQSKDTYRVADEMKSDIEKTVYEFLKDKD